MLAIAEDGAERIHQSLLVHQQKCHGEYVEVKVRVASQWSCMNEKLSGFIRFSAEHVVESAHDTDIKH